MTVHVIVVDISQPGAECLTNITVHRAITLGWLKTYNSKGTIKVLSHK